jgi:4,5-DOPA dioxygenase extradiol
MNRKVFLQKLGLAAAAGVTMKLNSLGQIVEPFGTTDKMPVLFVGHGSPMNAIEENRFTKQMKALGSSLERPNAILMISAHWETKGTFVTAQDAPPTIHDFGGFPQALFDAQYPAPGSQWLEDETIKAITSTPVSASEEWGLDHGCLECSEERLSQRRHPGDTVKSGLQSGTPIPLRLGQTARQHLRTKGVLIMGSGNMVHNLGRVSLKSRDFNESYGFDWAIEANDTFKKVNYKQGAFSSLINYKDLGNAIKLAVPTPEHYLPLLYTLALQDDKDSVSFFNDDAIGGSLTMTSVIDWVGFLPRRKGRGE